MYLWILLISVISIRYPVFLSWKAMVIFDYCRLEGSIIVAKYRVLDSIYRGFWIDAVPSKQKKKSQILSFTKNLFTVTSIQFLLFFNIETRLIQPFLILYETVYYMPCLNYYFFNLIETRPRQSIFFNIDWERPCLVNFFYIIFFIFLLIVYNN